ncbi:hypothetical protein ACBJ59_00785 [Nonomuraea sp. MTCD27]|uniref:hypothetical protein n=1 Tax=Nonomuraea sp. MTCD27 TaxID=1676747 RepID=UPI0035BF4199
MGALYSGFSGKQALSLELLYGLGPLPWPSPVGLIQPSPAFGVAQNNGLAALGDDDLAFLDHQDSLARIRATACSAPILPTILIALVRQQPALVTAVHNAREAAPLPYASLPGT